MVVGKAGLKAGLIGMAVMVIVAVLNQFLVTSTVLSLVSCGIGALLYVGIGALAGFFVAPPRKAADGAKAGLIAGLIAGVVAAVVGSTILLIRLQMGYGMPGVDPQQLKQLSESGMNPGILIASGVGGLICGMALNVGAAAGGGALLAAIKPD
jgi:Na+/proline symporter